MSGRVPREFVDTNVFVYAHDRSAGAKQAQARRLIDRLFASGTGCLSVQVLQEVFVTLTRKVPRPLDEAAAEAVIETLSSWRAFEPRVGSVFSAIGLERRLGIAFWDAMILHAAAELECEIVWSEDLKAGQAYDGVTVRNPFAAAEA